MQSSKCLVIGCCAFVSLLLLRSVLTVDAQNNPTSVRISQIYGGGGNHDATLHSDFIELFNAAPAPISLAGWSVQYAAKESSHWAVTPLGDVTIAGFGYLLIRQAAGDGGSDADTALAAPDVVGDLSLSATDGKVALVMNTAPILSATDSTVVDLVGYGNANEAELVPAPALSNTTALLRLAGGCIDQQQNALDFERLSPLPRNRTTPSNPCSSAAALLSEPAPTLSEPPLPITATLPVTTEPITATSPLSEPATLAITPTVAIPPPVEPTPIELDSAIALSITATATLLPTLFPLPTAVELLPSPTSLPTPIAPVVEIPTALPSETPIATATEDWLPTATATTLIPPVAALSTPLPRVLITEFLADPKAVADEQGEWLELYNADTVAVNLAGWRIADLGSDQHTVASPVWLQPGQYVVLARQGETSLNGGVTPAYVYQNLVLANSADELVIFAPDGTEIDRVIWGDGTSVSVKAGASAQRIAIDVPAGWENSQAPWPGSLGDAGSPGAAYQPPAVPATPTSPPTTPLPTATPSITWPLATQPSVLQIDEVFYLGSDEEFIVLQNTSTTSLDLSGWLIGDAEFPGKSEGIYALPTGRILGAGELLVLARDGSAFRNRWGQPAHAEFTATDPDTADLARRRDLAHGELALNDSGDEIVLLNPAGEVADAVAFGVGNFALLGLSGSLKSPSRASLHAVPPARFPAVREVRHRFLYAPPDPWTAIPLPLANPLPAPQAEDGLSLVWGSVGASSIFGDGSAPPHYLLAAAATQGFHFLAVADPITIEPWQVPPTLVALPAWRWLGAAGERILVYNGASEPIADQAALLAYLDATATTAQWQGRQPPAHARLALLAADQVSAPDTLAALYQAWFAAAAPLLPVGNAAPALPGVVAPTNRYTGLAVTAVNAGALQEAMAARRGWVTSTPGLWLTLRAQRPDGSRHWMGTTLVAENAVILDLDYGDSQGEVAGVAIWQDDKPIHQLATPMANGRWRVTLATVPNSFLYAVATQADGDFAVTAPFYVLPTNGGEAVLLNEVLPAPGADHNHDGAINSDDEYIELYNPNDHPVSLVGWQLSDAAGDLAVSRRFTFGPGRYIGGRSWLLLRRSETKLNLNNTDDHIRLLNPAGEEIDQIGWAQSPRRGRSLSRLPEGGAWQEGTATPGHANQAAGDDDDREQGGNNNHGSDSDDDDQADDSGTAVAGPPPVRLDPTHGQAGGPPGSIAQSKLAGLEQWVEFRAVVTAPPGLYNATIYVADPVPDAAHGPLAGIGINIYLRRGEFPSLAEGDRIVARGLLRSFRGEMELQLDTPDQIGHLTIGLPLQPLTVTVSEIGESLEGRLVTFTGTVSGWQGDSIYLIDPTQPTAEAVRVTVRSSLDWRRPYVNRGEQWRVTGIVSQFAREAPWNGGYRILVRYPHDLVELKP
ncbi:MAG: lamin tail domain-containing protein [Caldilineaceae bacterium]|nr:lamin tail domain-containing protein [Caldilineaceae bacterium]